MKTLSLGISLGLLTCAATAPLASAQRYDRRVDVPEIVNADRDYRSERGGDWERRVREDLNQLNADVARTRSEIGDSRNGWMRDRFHSIRERTDRLNAAWSQRRISGWEARRRIDDIRGQLSDLRGAMHRRDSR
ncbi:MAG: hypothetical protein ACJ8HU_08695 [Chthoniobacterales bacterium]